MTKHKMICPKCAGLDIATSYHNGSGYYKGCGGSVTRRFNSAEEQHLHRVCRTCGYDWTTGVASVSTTPDDFGGRDV